MKTILIILLLAVSATQAKSEVPVEIQHMKTLFKYLEIALDRTRASDILLVFDIDNTLLSTNQELGSYRWGQWQKKLIMEGSLNAVVSNMPDLYKLETKLYSLSNMHATEVNTPARLQNANAQGVYSIALTSRGPQMRSVTKKEINKNNYAFKSFSIGFPFEYLPNIASPRPVSFQDGLYLTAGQNKGKMLRDLLRRTKKNFKLIIFVDDTLKHTKHMIKAFENTKTKVIAFRYGFMDSKLQNFEKKNKNAVIQQWKSFKRLMDLIFI